MTEQERAALETELAALLAANKAATEWDAAAGERVKRIQSISRQLDAPTTEVRSGEAVAWRGKAIERWQTWRDADHKDTATISRSDVCTLLDEIFRLDELIRFAHPPSASAPDREADFFDDRLAKRGGIPDSELLELLVASGYDASEVHPTCYANFGWTGFVERLVARLPRPSEAPAKPTPTKKGQPRWHELTPETQKALLAWHNAGNRPLSDFLPASEAPASATGAGEGLLDRPVQFEECSTAEPTLRQLVAKYYGGAFYNDRPLADRYIERYIALLASSASRAGEQDEIQSSDGGVEGHAISGTGPALEQSRQPETPIAGVESCPSEPTPSSGALDARTVKACAKVADDLAQERHARGDTGLDFSIAAERIRSLASKRDE